jgi:hypothetical protein
VKKKVTPLVERFYGFETSKAQESLNDNITNVQNLKTNSAFINDDRGQRLPYRHPVIQKAVNIIWFNDRSSDGIAFYNNFNPMPYEAIALVLAVVRGLRPSFKYSINDVLRLKDRVLYRRMDQRILG